MIGQSTPTATPSWKVALRDGLLVLAATIISSVAATTPSSWTDFFQFEHVGIPILTGLQVFIYSFIYNYKVTIPPTPT